MIVLVMRCLFAVVAGFGWRLLRWLVVASVDCCGLLVVVDIFV